MLVKIGSKSINFFKMIIYDDLSANMKKVVQILGMLLFIGLVLSSFAFAYWYLVSGWDIATDGKTPRQISVSGEGKIAVRPDISIFTAGVLTQARMVGEAQAENARRSSAVIDFLKKEGIEEKDVKTVNYSIYPQQQFFDVPPCYTAPCPPRRPPEIVGYEIRHTLEVKVRDLNKVDVMLAGVVDKGANEVGSVRFSVDDEEKVREEARQKAIADAKEKAQAIAKDLGVRLTRLVAFSESGGMPFPVRFEALGKGGGGDFAPTPQIEPGEQEVQSFVNVVYEFR